MLYPYSYKQRGLILALLAMMNNVLNNWVIKAKKKKEKKNKEGPIAIVLFDIGWLWLKSQLMYLITV